MKSNRVMNRFNNKIAYIVFNSVCLMKEHPFL